MSDGRRPRPNQRTPAASARARGFAWSALCAWPLVATLAFVGAMGGLFASWEPGVVTRPAPHNSSPPVAVKPVGASVVSVEASRAIPRLRVRGADLVDPEGRVVTLRGCNIGNWLLIEPWMFGVFDEDIRDQHTFLTILRERFGEERTHALMETHREGWFTARDAALIASFGFNAVRLPIHYSHLMDDEGAMRPDAFRWTDRAIELAEGAGLYVILDLHGAPGGQSVDAPTGRIGQNRLWSEREMQDRTVRLWSALAERYAGRPSVAAYDLLNEPYGDFSMDVRAPLVDLIDRLHDAVRAHDPDTLILAPGTIRGLSFYGDPAERGWTNTGFTEHFYPTIFGDTRASIGAHRRFAESVVAHRAALLERWGAAYLVGEMNPVFERSGGAAMMRAHYDLYASLGWAVTMWSYKLYRADPGAPADNWWMVSNAEPFPIDIRRDDYDTLLARFERFGDEALTIDEPLREAMTGAGEPALLASVRAEGVAAFAALPAPWDFEGVGVPGVGGARVEAVGGGGVVRAEVFGGGRDIWGSRDEFGYLSRPASAGASLFARIDAFGATHRFAKAGVMARAGSGADAAHVFVHVFPDGRVVLAERPERGGATRERTLATVGLPARVGLRIGDDGVTAHYAGADGAWRAAALARDGASFDRMGLAVGAHEAEITARAVAVLADEPDALPESARGGEELVRHAEFARGFDGWSRWGDALTVEAGGGVRWGGGGEPTSGLWQDITIERPGRPHGLTLDLASAEGARGGAIELRVETLIGDAWLTLESGRWEIASMGGADSARLWLAFTPDGERVRVLAVFEGNGGGAVARRVSCVALP